MFSNVKPHEGVDYLEKLTSERQHECVNWVWNWESDLKLRIASSAPITIPSIPLQPSYYSCPLWSFIDPPGPMTRVRRNPPSRLWPWGRRGVSDCVHSQYCSQFEGRGCDLSSGQLLVWLRVLLLRLMLRPPEKRKSFFVLNNWGNKDITAFFRHNKS